MQTTLENTVMTIKSYLPVFNGFYGTFFQYDNEDMDIEGYNEANNTDLNYDAFDFDYAEHNKRVSEACVGHVEDYFKSEGYSIKIKFLELYSPREYNFTNDVIQVQYEIGEKDFSDLIQYCFEDNTTDFQEYITENYASRSGFVSFVEDDLTNWKDIFLKEKSQYFNKCFGALLEFYCMNEGYTHEDLQSEVSNENHIGFELKETQPNQ